MPATGQDGSRGPLAGLRVVDWSTLVAGPACGRYFADFGATVIKVESPTGDSARTMGWNDPRDGVSFWWKLEGRGKLSVVLDLRTPDGIRAMRALCADADVLVENFRPGTLERLGLSPDALIAANPRLVVVRISGFGQTGPYSQRPGFATIAEAMSGFADINGEAGGPPLLPPIALTDEVAGLAAAFSAMVALRSGVGQVVDISLIEAMFQMMGPLMAVYKLLGRLEGRLGSGIAYSVPRGAYETSDGKWVAISASADTIAKRVAALIGHADDPDFADPATRVLNREAVDRAVREWIRQRPAAQVLAAFEDANAAIGPIMSMADIATDPHYVERGVVQEVDGVPMPGLIARLSATPGRIRWAGRPLGADTEIVLAELDAKEHAS
jgi:crotonobetainyl-CoA:carnitine CoA-transferase CaiB-like acyl-CoA transferase